MSKAIVDRALDLVRNHADWPSLQVLDVAMDGHVGSHPDFEAEPAGGFNDWLSPPSPFATLLHSAFGNHLDSDEVDAEAPGWHQVIEAFGARYQLWQ